MILMKYLKI